MGIAHKGAFEIVFIAQDAGIFNAAFTERPEVTLGVSGIAVFSSREQKLYVVVHASGIAIA